MPARGKPTKHLESVRDRDEPAVRIILVRGRDPVGVVPQRQSLVAASYLLRRGRASDAQDLVRVRRVEVAFVVAVLLASSSLPAARRRSSLVF